MRGSIIAKRYARAFARLVGPDPQTGQRHLMALSSVKSLFAVDEARRILVSPVMPSELKGKLIDYALETGKADPIVGTFMQTILEARRVDLIPAIISAYEELLDELSGRVKALVTTAVPLTSGDLESVRSMLAEALGKTVDVGTEVDPAILGGLVIRLGNSLIDLSMRSRLKALTTSAAL